MGWKDFKNKIFPNDYDDVDMGGDYDDEGVYQDEPEEQLRETKAAQPTYGTPAAQNGVQIASGRSSSIEMKVVSPTKFDAVTQIADLLLNRKTVLLNLENTNKETAKRLIDFLSGVAYALGGDVQKVADNTFAVTPNNVAVSNESVESSAPAAAEDNLYE